MPKRDVAGGFTRGETCKRLQPIQAPLVQVTQLAQKSQSILLPSAGMRVVNLRGQGVQLLMKGLDGLEGGRHASRGKSLHIEPRAQAAWLRIERRRGRPRALQVRQ